MAIKLGSLDRWSELPVGKSISFVRGPFRRVRVQFNARVPCALDIVDPAGEVRFLAAIPAGLSTVEFGYGGEFGIISDAPCPLYYQTAEDEPTCVCGDGESFTNIVARPARNMELERMMFLQEQNMRKREARLAAEYNDRLAAMERKLDGETGIHGRKAAKHKESVSEADGEILPADTNSGRKAPDSKHPAPSAGAGSGGKHPEPLEGEAE